MVVTKGEEEDIKEEEEKEEEDKTQTKQWPCHWAMLNQAKEAALP